MISRTSEILKSLRTEKGYSQAQLAQKLKAAQNTISNWENGTREPDLSTIAKLAEIFDVSTDYLLGKTAFKKPMELYEYWGGHNNPYFEAPFDFGGFLKKERESQNISQKEVSEALNLTESDVDDIENGVLPINYDWAEKYANFLGTSVLQIFIDNGMSCSLNDIPLELLHHYQEQGMTEIEMAMAYLKFKEAEKQDAINEEPTSTLTPKEERDIARDLEKMLSNLESKEALAFNGEPLDEETKELMRISLESSMRMGKQIAKQKFTPKKYKK